MKKKVFPFIVVLIAAALLLSGCLGEVSSRMFPALASAAPTASPASAPEPAVRLSGTYALSAVSVDGETITVDELKFLLDIDSSMSGFSAYLDMSFDFSGGKVTVHVAGQSADGTYTLKGEKLTMYDGVSSMVFTYQDDQISIDESGATLIFTKGAPAGGTFSTSPSDVWLTGTYALSSAYSNGETYSVEQLKESLEYMENGSLFSTYLDMTLTFSEYGTVTLSFGGLDISSSYTLDGTELIIQNDGASLYFTYADGKLSLSQDGTVLIFDQVGAGASQPAPLAAPQGLYTLDSFQIGEFVTEVEDVRDKADDNPFFAEAEKYLDLSFTFSGSRVLAIMMGETFELSCRVDGSQVTLSAEDASPILTFTYENEQLYLDAEDGVTLIFSRQGPLEI